MNNTRWAIPYFFTLANLFCGMLSIAYGFNERLVAASWLIIVAGLMDGLDGKIARFTGASTRFGVEFDSMADLVSFAIAPSVLLYQSILARPGHWEWVLIFIYVASGAFRLARFNYHFQGIRKDYFRGMPITMSGMTLAASIIFFDHLDVGPTSILLLSGLTFILAPCMMSLLRYEGLPSFHLETHKDKMKALVLFWCVVLMVLNPALLLFPLMAGYLLLGPVQWILSLLTKENMSEYNGNAHSSR